MRTRAYVALAVIGLILSGRVVAAENIEAPIRAIHFVLGPGGKNAPNTPAITRETAEEVVRAASRHGFNTAVVQLANGVRWKSAPELARPQAWSVKEFVQFAEFVTQNGLVLVPEIKLLTHQEKLLGRKHPDLMFNQSTYDPRNEKTYQLVFALLDEIIQAIHPKAIHIGHDEVAGHARYSREKWLRDGEQTLPASLFLQDVNRIHEYLKQRGIETWMWGDMLISPAEFPSMAHQSLHGAGAGYGKKLREQLSRDIVICDWHYRDDQAEFPSLSAFKAAGFRVLGTTSKKEEAIRNFSRYAAENGADGMIATTWTDVPRNELESVESTFRISGEVFRKYFPDRR